MNSAKPRYTLREGKMIMANDVVAGGKFALPAHLQGKPKMHSWGTLDPSQRMLPRIKLLQATSPECADYPREAIAGEFWHTTLTISLGNEIVGVPLFHRESYVLWTPKGVPGQEGGILARARDFIHWDPPNGVFHVRFPNNPKTYTWKTAKTVKESGLDKFGSSRTDDDKSHPAATLTYEILWYLPDFNSLALTLNSRGSVNEAKRLVNMIDAKPTDAFNQRYKICSQRKQGPGDSTYFGYIYRALGYCDAQLSAITEPLFEQWRNVAFAIADESEEDEAPAQKGPVPPKAHADIEWSEPRGQAGVIDNDDEIPF